MVILPTLNEREGLQATFASIPVRQLLESGHRLAVVVIDGGSTDGTIGVAERLGLPVLHQVTRGKGMAVREALGWARAQGVRFALVMDADATYPAEMIGPVLDLLKAGGELIVGVRNPESAQASGLRDIIHRVGNALLNSFGTQVAGQAILDLCSGFYGIDLRTRLDQGLNATGFEIEAEMFLKAYRTGVRVIQIPITYRERIGVAKLRAVRDGLRIFVSILRSSQAFGPSSVRPERPRTILRELLNAATIHGSRDLVVVSHSSRMIDAQSVLDQLQGTQFTRALIVPEPPHPAGAPSSDPPPFAGIWPNAAVLHLGAKNGTPGTARGSAVIYLPHTHRVIRLDLGGAYVGPAEGVATHPVPVHALSRSGARRTGRATTRLIGSVQTLGALVDTSGYAKEMALLGANGFQSQSLLTPSAAGPVVPTVGSDDPALGKVSP